MTKLYCITYRTGGTVNFKWHRSLAMTYAEARKALDDTKRMGYHALIVPYAQSLIVGLPDTYSATS